MSVKNTKLKFEDLHQGKVFYIGEAGGVVVNCKVLGRITTCNIKSTGYAWGNGTYDPANYGIDGYWEYVTDRTEFTKQCPASTNADWAVKYPYHIPSQWIKLDIDGVVYEVQDIYFDASECRMRAFSKRSQAVAWSKYPAEYQANLKSFLTEVDV